MIFLKFPRNYGKIFGFHTYNLKKRCELSLSFGKNYVGMNHGCESSVRLVFLYCIPAFLSRARILCSFAHILPTHLHFYSYINEYQTFILM